MKPWEQHDPDLGRRPRHNVRDHFDPRPPEAFQARIAWTVNLGACNAEKIEELKRRFRIDGVGVLLDNDLADAERNQRDLVERMPGLRRQVRVVVGWAGCQGALEATPEKFADQAKAHVDRFGLDDWAWNIERAGLIEAVWRRRRELGMSPGGLFCTDDVKDELHIAVEAGSAIVWEMYGNVDNETFTVAKMENHLWWMHVPKSLICPAFGTWTGPGAPGPIPWNDYATWSEDRCGYYPAERA